MSNEVRIVRYLKRVTKDLTIGEIAVALEMSHDEIEDVLTELVKKTRWRNLLLSKGSRRLRKILSY